MCVVSTVIDKGRELWPSPWQPVYPTPWEPNTVKPIPFPHIKKDSEIDDMRTEIAEIKKWIQAIKDAEKIDILTKQPDCVDPKKAPWIDDLLNRLAALEKSVANLTKKNKKRKFAAIGRNKKRR